MYWDGTSELDRVEADELFKDNMYTLIENGKQWRWLKWMRIRAANRYYFVVSKFGAMEFRRKQRVKKERKEDKIG